MRAGKAGWSAALIYHHADKQATWRLQRGDEVRYLKLVAHGWYPGLAAEHVRLEWAKGRVPVAEVLGYGVEDDVEWMLLAALPGLDATKEPLRSDPARLVPILARGLRAFHDAPTQGCPFDFTLEPSIAHARRRVEEGLVDAGPDFHPEHAHHTSESALAELEARRPAGEDIVLCHGDYCLPNVLIEKDRVTGYIDLGEMGLADRWWDLAVATWSVTWNLGQGWEDLFLESYGIARDDERTAFYRLLYDLSS